MGIKLFETEPDKVLKSPVNKKIITDLASNTPLNTNNKLPTELLILNRFGIGYPYLNAALKVSQKYQIAPSDVLIKAKIITPETWVLAQAELAKTRQQAVTKRKQEAFLLNQSIHNLSDHLPHYSAKNVFTWQQVLFLIICAASLFWLFQTNQQETLLACFMFLMLFYTGIIFLRGLLLASFKPLVPLSTDLSLSDDKDLLTYSVLVALYKEANQVEALTNSLWRLDWPREKLDIKLICEADDYATIEAILDAKLPSCFELIQVPPALPRTKPKALNYALPLCRGDYLVLYDAEDHPSPGQLREAYLTFNRSDKNIACLQAPLHIHNQDQNWLTAMFAIEYVTLFNGILPVLAKWKVPIPLGGTSNHFKMDVLKKVGGWDPYNVTEDADLGIRLFREGYRCSTITQPTYEEAPSQLMPWVKQRTRWIKGWMQTVLVHSRNPIDFVRDIGLKNAIAFHLLLTSIIISAIIHPLFIFISLSYLLNLSAVAGSGFDSFVIVTSVFNLVGGYTTYALLAYAVLQDSKYKSFSKLLFTIPFYWFLVSLAGWRALLHLIARPHEWEKTPHGLVK